MRLSISSSIAWGVTAFEAELAPPVYLLTICPEANTILTPITTPKADIKMCFCSIYILYKFFQQASNVQCTTGRSDSNKSTCTGFSINFSSTCKTIYEILVLNHIKNQLCGRQIHLAYI